MDSIKRSRKFHWLSSVDSKNNDDLHELDMAMKQFYNQSTMRAAYKAMISTADEVGADDEVTIAFVQWFKQHVHNKILEVGCGTGRIFKEIKNTLPPGSYTGIELSADVIESNQLKWPEQYWYNSGLYDAHLEEGHFDLIFSFYVLEHLVYPKTALETMFRLLTPGGYLVIVCPDFAASGRFPSQHLGLSMARSAKAKLQEGKVLDAVLSLYDSRCRLKPSLKLMKRDVGCFKINVNPACLYYKEEMWPDIDAVYLAFKEEFEYWAKQNQLTIEYPAGKSGIFNEHVFIVLQKKEK